MSPLRTIPDSLTDHVAASPSWLRERVVLLVRHGSHAYGTSRPDSDLDAKGVCVPPREILLGFRGRFEQSEQSEPVDCVIYALAKFMRLAAECNPNIIEVLWVHDDDVLHSTAIGDALRAARRDFLSRKARFTFSGYAISQLKRIRTHRRWLLSPPDAPPTREAFGLPETMSLSREQLGAAQSLIEGKMAEWDVDLEPYDTATRIGLRDAIAKTVAELTGLADGGEWSRAARSVGYDENFIELIRREKQYRSAKTEWRQYQSWRKHRNAARAALESQFGYDVKHAMHLVRLLRMCEEILRDGEVRVRRPDAEELLEIRGGAWSYDELIAWAEAAESRLDGLVRESELPEHPEVAALDALCERLTASAMDMR